MNEMPAGSSGGQWNTTAAVAAATGVSATLAATATSATGKELVITHFSGSCSLAGTLVSIQCPTGTTIWQQYVQSDGKWAASFDPPLKTGQKEKSASFVVAATATNVSAVNAAGFMVTHG